MKKLCFGLAAILIIAISGISLSQTASAETYSLEESLEVLPASYTSEYISPTKDQGYHGNCWAFGPIATLESNLKAMGYLNDDSPGGFFDLSEQAVSFDLIIKCAECGGKCSLDYQRLSFICEDCGEQGYGPNRTINDAMLEGGFEEFVWGYYTSNRGPLKESDVPYFYGLDAVPPENFSEMQSLFSITDVVSVVPTTENLKRGIVSYGAMTINCAMDSYKAGIVQNNDGRYSYTIASTKMMPEMAAHAMSVVGYDDNFSKDKFHIDRGALTAQLNSLANENPAKLAHYLESWDVESLTDFKALSEDDFNALFLPENNGAWLLKNSWGEGVRSFQGEGSYDICGLIWVSYEDASLYNLLPGSRAYAVSGIKTADTSTRYQLDEFGAANHFLPKEVIDRDSYAVINIFDFSKDSRNKLDYITFETVGGKGCEYEIYYAGVDSEGGVSPDYSLMPLIVDGTIPHDGYVTIDIAENIILPEGKGALVMKVISDGAPIKFGMDTDFFDWYQYGNEVVYYYFPLVSGNSLVLSDGALYSPYEAFGRDADFCLKAGVTATQDAANISFGYADYAQAKQLLMTLEAFSIEKKHYTKESWQRYQDALVALNQLNENKNLTYSQQQSVDSAVAELSNAIDDLENKHTWDFVLAALALAAALITVALMVALYLPSIRKKKE